MDTNEIKLLKKQDDTNKLTDLQIVEKLYDFLQGGGQENTSTHRKVELTSKKAFHIIYYLQEHIPLLPDRFERCSDCGTIYDTWSEGNHIESTDKFQCGGCYN